jgi:CheY-like chemotaxis protein
VQPNLVILCVRIDDADGFQVLSMLKLDEATRGIPVLTYTTEYDGQDSEDEAPEQPDEEIFPTTSAVWMN